MLKKILGFTLLFILSSNLHAQDLMVFGGTETDRGSTRILFWDGAANSAKGQVAINFGRPEWKAEYEEGGAFDSMTKGKVWRFGKNFWTNYNADFPVVIEGKEVAAGHYYLGVHRSADGKNWSLAFINPADIYKSGLDASQANDAKVSFKAPLNYEKTESSTEYMSVDIKGDESDKSKATLTISWGHSKLTADLVLKR